MEKRMDWKLPEAFAERMERLLEEIREIRLSERRFYQKITDIYGHTAFGIIP